jgi:hypothetical protein
MGILAVCDGIKTSRDEAVSAHFKILAQNLPEDLKEAKK